MCAHRDRRGVRRDHDTIDAGGSMIVVRPAARAARSSLFILSLAFAACASTPDAGSGNGDGGGSGDDLSTDDFASSSEPDLLGVDLVPFLDVQPASLQTITVAPDATT